jgi:hypothetical protein
VQLPGTMLFAVPGGLCGLAVNARFGQPRGSAERLAVQHQARRRAGPSILYRCPCGGIASLQRPYGRFARVLSRGTTTLRPIQSGGLCLGLRGRVSTASNVVQHRQRSTICERVVATFDGCLQRSVHRFHDRLANAYKR